MIDLLNKYGVSASYFHHQGQMFVSTFASSADDWHQIKAATGCFFMPYWSSLGAKAAMQACGGVADGLFTTTEVALSVPPEFLFDPPTCVGGFDAGDYSYNELCLFTCAHGFCPSAVCSCQDTDFLNWMNPNATEDVTGVRSIAGDDHGLCAFACAHGVCPDYTCLVPDSDGDEEDGYGPLYDYIEEEYFGDADPGEMTSGPSVKPQTLDDPVNGINAASVPPMCWEQWALDILFSTLLSLQGQYDLASVGYDSLYRRTRTTLKTALTRPSKGSWPSTRATEINTSTAS